MKSLKYIKITSLSCVFIFILLCMVWMLSSSTRYVVKSKIFDWQLVKDSAQGFSFYMEIAELGNSEAQLFIGRCYANGHGVPQDYAEAFKWVRKSAEQGNDFAQNELGLCYANEKASIRTDGLRMKTGIKK